MPTEKQRREAARRHLERQLQRRQERETRRKKITLITSIAGTLVIIAAIVVAVVLIGGGDKGASTAGSGTSSAASSSPAVPSSTTPSTAAAAAYPCTWTLGGTASKKVSPPTTNTPPRTGTVTAKMQTSQGNLTFSLDRKAAPCAVASFVSLAQQHYFDATPCHRLTTSGIYVLQCGDPSGKGSGGPGYSFNDELTGKEKYTRGVLAMANAGPNTNGSQFFIVYKDSPLPPSYTVFGHVASGLAVVDKVAAKGSNNANGQGDGKPNLPVEIQKVTVGG